MQEKSESKSYKITLTEGIFAAVVFFAAIIGYILTLAPTVSFWDAGEFIAAAHSLGIPHPPGTPLYVLIGKIFSLIPVFGLATVTQKINFMSAFLSSMGIVFLFLISVRLMKEWHAPIESLADGLIIYVPAAIGSLIAGFNFSYWNNAVESEVYGIAMFIIGISIWLSYQWYDRFGEYGNNNRLLLIVYLLSLGVGNHLLCFLAAPGIFFLIAFKDWRIAIDTVVMAIVVFLVINFILLVSGLAADMYPVWMILMAIIIGFVLIWTMWPNPNIKFIMSGVILFLIGLSVHAYLPIRSALNPMIDEGSPESMQALMDVLLRKQYGASSMFDRRADFVFQFSLWWKYFMWQYGGTAAKFLPLFTLGTFGAWWHFLKNKKSFFIIFVHFIITSLGLIIYLNLSDHEVRDRDYFFVAGFYFFSGWIGYAVNAIAEIIRTSFAKTLETDVSKALQVVVVFMCILLIAIPVYGNFKDATRAKNYVPHDYGYNILASVDENGLIFTNGDNDTFPLWYVQLVPNFRQDVTVMNLSLLNTPWYIKQLRDNPPHNLNGIITWSDEEIDRLQPFYLGEDYPFELGNIKLKFEKGKLITVKDLAVLHIIRNNWDRNKNDWKKPIFFAVTVADLMGFRPYLKLEGLVFRITQESGDYMISTENTINNLENKYRYTHLFDDDLYLDDNTKKLLSNYAAAYSRLAFEFHDKAQNIADPDEAEANRKEALKWMGKAIKFAPYNDTGTLIWRSYGAMQEGLGQYNDALQSYRKSIEQDRSDKSRAQTWQLMAKTYYFKEDYDSAIVAIKTAKQLDPQDERIDMYIRLYESELKKKSSPDSTKLPTNQ